MEQQAKQAISIKGIVLEWDITKGEGWIESEDGVKYFAHTMYVARKELQPSFFKRLFTNQDLEKGEIVEFEVFDWNGNEKKIKKFGLRANNIRPIERIEKLKMEREQAKAKKEKAKEEKADTKPADEQPKNTDAPQPQAAA